MPFKNLRKSREYSRLYMRKLRAKQKGLTNKTPELNPVKPINVKPQVKPEPCPRCRTLAEVQKAYENLRQQVEAAKEKQRKQ
jgi:hypothetical protein